MSVRRWSLLVLLGLTVLLFSGCEEAEPFPQSRELVVVNGTTDVQIIKIEIEVYPFGQRAIAPVAGYFQISEVSPLEIGERFDITVSPFVYQAKIRLRYTLEDDDSDPPWTGSREVYIDFPDKASMPTTLTLVNDGNIEFPGHTIEITGEYVTYTVPLLN